MPNKKKVSGWGGLLRIERDLEKQFLEILKKTNGLWEFTAENELYGKLTCSYDPTNAQHTIGDHFRRRFLASKSASKKKLTQEEFDALNPDDAAIGHPVVSVQYMQAVVALYELLPLVLKAALSQVGHEAISRTLWELNGITHDIEGLKQSMLIDLVQQSVGKNIKRRMKARGRGGSEPEFEATNAQCVMLARCYPRLLKHWQETSRRRKGNPQGNWREYAKVDEPDTPDDLLDRLNDRDPYISRPSAIAPEHAARRCGIQTKGCSSSTLVRFRRRGRALLVVNQMPSLTDDE